MLEGMSIMQFLEWQAYLKIKAELRNPKARKTLPPGQSDPDVGMKILGSLKGYQKQRDKLKALGRLR